MLKFTTVNTYNPGYTKEPETLTIHSLGNRARLIMPGMTMKNIGSTLRYPPKTHPPLAWDRDLADSVLWTITWQEKQNNQLVRDTGHTQFQHDLWCLIFCKLVNYVKKGFIIYYHLLPGNSRKLTDSIDEIINLIFFCYYNASCQICKRGNCFESYQVKQSRTEKRRERHLK